jgi:hypothetical protein
VNSRAEHWERRPTQVATGWLAGGLVLGALLVVGVSGCSGSATATDSTASSSGSNPPPTTQQHHKKKHHKKKTHPPPTVGVCPPPAKALAGVYHPDRLIVLKPCQKASGVIQDVRDEEDGDLHILVLLDGPYRRLLNAGNYSQQHGWLVVEFMARDAGHLPEPTSGARITMWGAWVLDTDHGWREIHPVFKMRLGGRTYTSGPRFGGSPPGVGSSDAAETCRTATGKRCRGYGHVSNGGSSGGGGSGGAGCEPGYSPCLPITGDLNCSDIPDSKKPVHVTGSDPYNLDSDGDGLGCE